MKRLFNNFLLRVPATAVIGILVLLFIDAMLPSKNPTEARYYFDIAIAFILFTEGLFFIDRILDKKTPWFRSFKKRLLKQTVYSFIWILFIALIMLTMNYNAIVSNQENLRGFILSIVFGIINLYMLNTILITRTFLKDSQKHRLEQERLKREKLRADYNILQNQLNPHFLFNSLNVLISEIRHNQERAIEYCEILSDAYRYVLQSRNKDTVSLKTEIKAFNKHIFLQQVRFGDNIVLKCNLPDEIFEYELPPLTIHILIENILKHNIVSENKPLYIGINYNNQELIVTNNLQPRKDVISTGVGLKNIEQRYSLLTDRKVRVEKTETEFSVTIPLLGD